MSIHFPVLLSEVLNQIEHELCFNEIHLEIGVNTDHSSYKKKKIKKIYNQNLLNQRNLDTIDLYSNLCANSQMGLANVLDSQQVDSLVCAQSISARLNSQQDLKQDSQKNNSIQEDLCKAKQHNKKPFFVFDATFGAGGYSSAILKQFENAFVVACDRDVSVIPTAENLTKQYNNRFLFVNDKFGNIYKILHCEKVQKFFQQAFFQQYDMNHNDINPHKNDDNNNVIGCDKAHTIDCDNVKTCCDSTNVIRCLQDVQTIGCEEVSSYACQSNFCFDFIVADLGVSSMQIDTPERGFSFQKDGPLDMDMGLSDKKCVDILHMLSEKELADVIFQYGQEKHSRKIATNIKKNLTKIHTTLDLANVIHNVMKWNGKNDTATKTFQALRIFINDELNELRKLLFDGIKIVGKKFIVVTFHSLEDGIVKHFFNTVVKQNINDFIENDEFKKMNTSLDNLLKNLCEKNFDFCNQKFFLPSDEEIEMNVRSRSAKLRCIRRS